MSERNDGSTFTADNVSIRNLLINAYGVRDDLILDLPSWANDARWDVIAKITDPDQVLKEQHLSHDAAVADYRSKMKAILEERFGMKAHMETKDMPVYDMVVAKGGFKLQATTAPVGGRGYTVIHTGQLDVLGASLSSLADFLSDEVGRTVVDKTGLDGEYDIKLRWTPDDEAASPTDNGLAEKPPQITTALQEQLGLMLLSRRGAVKTLVVDHIERPEAN